MALSPPLGARELEVGTLFGGHYRIEARLGRGGMADVYRALDERNGRRLALKRRAPLITQADASLTFQFEREYHTLCELAHPRIIEVYDFGVSSDGPYYTMELLDGQDLRERGRLPWREASALLVDVASSLAIIHSRGLLHRDISPRNIRCTADGRAKLIDFGALMPIGPMKNLVGTPPFVPPEALQLQTLDARADLFALGVTAYWLLTGDLAYPARSLAELREVWARPLESVTRLQRDVPEALDHLVMSLLHLKREARPATAAEVMERLAGIAGLPRQERVEVTRAYLVTPPLVGRAAQLESVRAQLTAAGERGASIVIEGAKGTGRSRFLDACVLEAKLLGTTVLRADAADATAGDWGAAGSLARQLLRELPQLAQASTGLRRNVLAFLAPGLVPEAPPTAAPQPALPAPPKALPATAAPEPALLQAALNDWLATLARSQPLVLAIDDAESLDAPSAAWLATLALRADRRHVSLLFATTLEIEAAPPLAVMRALAHHVVLEPLAAAQTEALLRGVFGIEQVAAVAGRIHQLSEGNPRETMALIAWLVERGMARYEAGSWTLPVELQPSDLPTSLTAAWSDHLATLNADARELGEALSLTDAAVLAAEDYAELTAHGQLARTIRALDELLAAGILVAAGKHYRFRQPEFPELLSRSLAEERSRTFHRRIARVLSRYDKPILLAHHLLSAGEERAAIQRVLPLSLDPNTEISSWALAIAQRVVAAAERQDLPARSRIELQMWLVGYAAILGDYELFMHYTMPLLQHFQRGSGLSDYLALDPQLPASERLTISLTQVQQRYDAMPESERSFTPIESIRNLALCCSACVNMASIAQSLELVEQLPSLEPLSPLSPALGVSQRLIDGMRAFQSGRYEEARRIYLYVLERVQEPDQGGLDPLIQQSVRLGMMYFQAVISTLRGIPSAADWLPELEREVGHRVNAWRVHMASELMQGNYPAAASCQRRSELAQVQDGQQIRYRGTTVRLELLAYARASDLLGVKRTLERIEPVARMHPRWQVDLYLARYHYARLQGDNAAALEAIESALQRVAPGRHINWTVSVAAHLRALCAVGRTAEAVERGKQYLIDHDRAGLSGMRSELNHAWADALLAAGRLAEAAECAQRAIVEAEALGSRGVFLGARYETRARIALAMGDRDTFASMATSCAREYKPGNHPTLTAQYERLLRDAAYPAPAATLRTKPDTARAQDDDEDHAFTARLRASTDADERAQRALELLLEATGASAGYLFGVRDGQLRALASIGSPIDPARPLWQSIESYLARCLLGDTRTHATPALGPGEQRNWIDAQGRQLSPLLLVGERDAERAFAALAALHLGERSTPLPPTRLRAIADALLHEDEIDVLTVVV